MTSTSPGSWGSTSSSCRCWRRPWTAWSRRAPRASSASSAGWPCSTSRACSRATRTPRSSWSGSAGFEKDEATAEMQRIYQEPIKPELISKRIREVKDMGVPVAASLTPQRVRTHYEVALEAGLDILVVQGTVISAEHVSDRRGAPAAEPQGVHARAADPGRGGRLCLLLHRPAPHAHRREGRAGRRRPRRGVHHARRAGHRRPAGHRHRRRGRGPLAAHAGDGRVREGHRRRRHAQRWRHLQGRRLRRRRRDDRLAAGPRLRGARPRLPLGHGHLPSRAAARRPGEDHPERHRWSRS